MPKRLKSADLILSLVDDYPDFVVNIYICNSEKSLLFMCDFFASISDPPLKYSFENTEAIFMGYVGTKKKLPNPIGFIICQYNSAPGTFVHELFHAARYYFRLIGKRINEKKDETFAELLGALVDEFYKQCKLKGIKLG